MIQQNHFTITQASEITGYEPHVIRYYEKEFSLDIPRNKANHRYFTQSEINILKQIKQLQEKGFNNTQIKLMLTSSDTAVQDQDYNRVDNLDGVNQEASELLPHCNYMESIDISIEEFKKEIIREIFSQLEPINQDLISMISKMSAELAEVTLLLKREEDDVLLCENAKLRMQLKQKTFELLEVKEQLRKERGRNQNFLGKVFKK